MLLHSFHTKLFKEGSWLENGCPSKLGIVARFVGLIEDKKQILCVTKELVENGKIGNYKQKVGLSKLLHMKNFYFVT